MPITGYDSWTGIRYFQGVWWIHTSQKDSKGVTTTEAKEICWQEAIRLFVRPDVTRLDPNQTFLISRMDKE